MYFTYSKKQSRRLLTLTKCEEKTLFAVVPNLMKTNRFLCVCRYHGKHACKWSTLTSSRIVTIFSAYIQLLKPYFWMCKMYKRSICHRISSAIHSYVFKVPVLCQKYTKRSKMILWHSFWVVYDEMLIFGSHTLVFYRAVLLLDLHIAHYMPDRKATIAAATTDIHSLRTNNSLKSISFPLNAIAAYCCCLNFDSNMEIMCVKLRC